MRRLICTALAPLLLAGVVLAISPAAQAAAAPNEPAPGPTGITAAGAVVARAGDGTVLWSRGLDRRRPIASITKVMTALVVVNGGHLGRELRVPAAAVTYVIKHDASNAGLRAGDRLTIRALLAAMLLPSGADAAYTLAHAWPGGWQAFVAKMNATARQIGMTRTHFANFDGLPWPTEHSTYSTPHALLRLARAVLTRPLLSSIVARRRYAVAATRRHHHYVWHTTNLLLGSYRGVIGIKTGFTLAAGHCLLFAARRAGETLDGVVLHSTVTSPDAAFAAARKLLTWGFSQP